MQVLQKVNSSQGRDSREGLVEIRVNKLMWTKIENEDTKLSCLSWALEASSLFMNGYPDDVGHTELLFIM